MYCKKCKITVKGNKTACPLCKGHLSNTEDTEGECFPTVKKDKITNVFLVKLTTLISVSVCVISLAVNFLLPQNGWWSFFVLGGIGCFWLAGIIGIVNRHKIIKNIFIQIFFLTIFALLWDLSMGFKGWSIDYAIPIGCLVGMVSVFVLSLTLKNQATEYMLYMMFSAIYGVVPGILLLTGALDVVIPSVICVVVSIIFIGIVITFQGRLLKEELKRIFHI